MFAYGNRTTVRNLTFDKANITTNAQYAAILFGSLGNGIIDNVQVKSTTGLSLVRSTSAQFCAGIAAEAYNTTFTDITLQNTLIDASVKKKKKKN